MQLPCPRCSRTLEYTVERPAFCSYCGSPLGQVSTEPDATTDYQLPDRTVAVPAGGINPDWFVPDQIAGYRLIRRLGVGGMGSVHEAEEDGTGRRVAVKLIAPDLVASGVAVERFLQEGRLASAIAHPRCVFVLAADQADGLPYIVMELMPGTTLKELVLEGGPLGVGEAVAKILDVIEGLREAHRIGVLHRDVKPSNCFLEADGRVKVGDFGLSTSLVVDAGLTRTGAFIGTPQYASPEQIRGDTLDARTDVYSVAATLYFLLTGRAPFEGGDAAATLARIVADPVPPPRNFNADIPRELERVILRGLERNRDRRYRDLGALRAALIPFVPGELSMAGTGLRLLAYVLEMALIRAAIIPLAMTVTEIRSFGSIVHLVPALDLLAFVIFYVLIEGITGASPAKWLMRLRVYRADAARTPGLGRTLLRASIFYGIGSLPSDLVIAVFWSNLPLLETTALIPRLAGHLILASTMRAGNGYRGLHELFSGTRVVRLPGQDRLSPSVLTTPAPRPVRELSRPEGMPEAIGPFRVDGALSWESGPRLLQGSDPGLGRSVWVVLRPADAPPPGPERGDLNRVTRPRWINGGLAEGRRWDAFVAPTGRTLDELRHQGGPLPWRHARAVLDSLAEELEAACRDGTLPGRLAVEQVLVQPGGRVELLDFIDLDRDPDLADPEPERRSLALLHRVALAALSRRRSDPARPSLTPDLPLHARVMVDRLAGGPGGFGTLAEFREELLASRDRPTGMTFQQRAAGFAAFLLIAAALAAAIVVPLAALVFYFSMTSGDDPVVEAMMQRMVMRLSLALPGVVPLGWAAWAFVTRGGLSRRLIGLALVGPDGLPAVRWRCALREGLLWAFAFALALGPFLIEQYVLRTLADDRWVFPVAVGFLVAYAAAGVFGRRRLPHDWLAGTRVVPR